MTDQDYATVNGKKLRRTDFAYAPPGSEPSKWKLPIDRGHIEAALDLFARTDLPPGARREVAEEIARRAERFGISKERIEKFRREHLAGSATRNSEFTIMNSIAVLLTGAGQMVDTPPGMATQRPGAQLWEIAVAISGSWVKDGQAFSITVDDISAMVRNFDKRQNDMIVIDYEHASEMPEVARGGPVPAAGWIHGLRASDSRSQASGSISGTSHQIPDSLFALVEWTPEAEEMIREGEYRFFSPAIDWGATDKETGQPQGATLTSGALTNHPFLEELPPIMLSDGTVVVNGSKLFMHDAHGAPRERLGGETTMKKLKLRPIPEGEENAGHHAVVDATNGKPLGVIEHHVLAEYAAKHLGVNPDAVQDEEKALEGERDDPQALKFEARTARRQAFFLSEAVRNGKIDNDRAAALAETGQIMLSDYIRGREAEQLLESAIAQGKILPRDRAFFFRDALERPTEFAEFVKNASPAVRWGTKGIGYAAPLSVDEEIDLGVKKLMSEQGLDYAKGLKQFLTAHPDLGEQYRTKHSVRVGADGTAS